jgi:hypothetical protein
LKIEKARVAYREEHAAHAAGLHYLDVDPFGQHGDVPAADQSFVARLRQHRFTYREEHDHDAYAETEAAEQER